MPNFTPRSLDQNKRIHGLAGQNGIDRETLHDHAFEISRERTSKTSELSFDEANALIKRLGGEPLPASAAPSVRSQQRARQKAGVKQIESARQEKLIRDLARGRGMTTKGLEQLAGRMHVAWPPLTTEQGNKLVEALKAMNARDARRPKEAA